MQNNLIDYVNQNKIICQGDDDAQYLTYFTDLNIRSRLFKQIKLIPKKYIKLVIQLYQKIIIYLDLDIKTLINDHQQQTASYILTIGKSYPLGGVRLYLIHQLVNPKINDLRDLLPQVLGSAWTYKNSLNQIVQKMGQFTIKLLNYYTNKQILQIQRMGKYYPGQIFSYQLICDNQQLQKFVVLQKRNNLSIQKILCVSESNILLFKQKKYSKKQQKNQQKQGAKYELQMATNLQSINQIAYSKKQKALILNFKIFNKQNQDVEQVNYKFVSSNCINNIIRKIIKFIDKFQSIRITHFPIGKLQNSETSKLKNLKIQESEYKKNPNSENKHKLNIAYQNIIQYYTSRGQTFVYLVYMHKLNALLVKGAQV